MRILLLWLCLAAPGIILALCGVELRTVARPTSAQTQAPGDYWRLPYPAGSAYDVSPGYGYNEGTHDNEDSFALDLQLPENSYVSAIQQGRVQTVFTGSAYCNGYGNYIDIVDIGGFIHRYAHLNAVFVSEGDEVLPGWVIGRSGATGYTIPCGAAHLHFRITDPDSKECTSGECKPEPMSDQCTASCSRAALHSRPLATTQEGRGTLGRTSYIHPTMLVSVTWPYSITSQSQNLALTYRSAIATSQLRGCSRRDRASVWLGSQGACTRESCLCIAGRRGSGRDTSRTSHPFGVPRGRDHGGRHRRPRSC